MAASCASSARPSSSRTWRCCRNISGFRRLPVSRLQSIQKGKPMKLKALVAALAIGVAGVAAHAQDTGPIKIGMITDLSGVYADVDGPAGVEMVKWAVQDFGGKLLGRPIEVLSADHQNKADIGASVARKWIAEDHLAMLVGGTNSGVNLAMSKVADQGKIPIMAVGPGSARPISRRSCCRRS